MSAVYRVLASISDPVGEIMTIRGQVAVTPGTALPRPDQMAPPTLTAGNGQITIQQPTLPNLHGLALTALRFRYAPSADLSIWVTVSSLTFPFSIPGTNGTAYTVQQTAVTDAGEGAWSPDATATPTAGASVPAKMLPPALTPGEGALAVNLAEGTNNGGSTITSEDVQHSANSTGPWTTMTGVTDPVTISGLTSGVVRWVRSRSNNAIGSGEYSDPRSGIPLAPPAGIPAADVTVAGTALVAKLNEWKAGWNATVPAGKTVADARYIDVLSGTFPLLKLSNYSFPAPVHVRSADKTTLGAAWVKIECYNCGNLGFDFASVKATSMHGDNAIGALHFDGCTGAFFEYGQVRGPADYQVTNESKQDGVALKNSPGFRLRHTLITDWPVGLTIPGGAHDALIEGNVWNDMKGDDGKFAYSNRITFKDNWSSLTKRKYDPIDHVDYLQEQTATQVSAAPAEVDGQQWIGHMMYLKTVVTKTVQGLYVSGKGVRKNFTYYDCVLITNNNDSSWKTNAGFVTGDASNSYDSITALYPPPTTGGAWRGMLEGHGGSKTNCIEAMETAYTPPATNLKINIGVNEASANYAAQHAFFTGPIQAAASSKSPIHELMPVVGSQAHWDHASPKGAWRRLKAIIADGAHPGNSPNKVLAAHWQERWNWDGFVTS